MSESNAEITRLLRNIDDKLDVLITLSRLTIPKQSVTDEEKKILALCNKKNSVADMVSLTKKSRGSIEFILNSLRNKGLIKSMIVKEKTVYVKV